MLIIYPCWTRRERSQKFLSPTYTPLRFNPHLRANRPIHATDLSIPTTNISRAPFTTKARCGDKPAPGMAAGVDGIVAGPGVTPLQVSPSARLKIRCSFRVAYTYAIPYFFVSPLFTEGVYLLLHGQAQGCCRGEANEGSGG